MSTRFRALAGGVGVLLAATGYFQVQAAKLPDASLPLHSERGVSTPLQLSSLVPRPASSPLPQSTTPLLQSASPLGAVFNKYCVTCHNEKLKTGGLILDKIDLEHVGESAATWEKVLRKLTLRGMPPVGMPRPDEAMYQALVTWLETEIDRAAAAHPNPGRRAAIQRLNRAEYAAVIRDLLALDVDVRSLLPADEAGYGFDNIADVLSVSPGLLDRYRLAAQKISRLAVGDSTMRPVDQTYYVTRNLDQGVRVSEDLPFGSRGGTAIRHYFPLDGEYVVKIRLQRAFNVNVIRGLDVVEQLEVRLNDVGLKTFTVGGECVGSKEPRCIDGFTQTGGNTGGSEYEQTADHGLEVRFTAKAGTQLVGVSFLERTSLPEGVSPSRLPVGSNAFWGGGYDRQQMGVETVVIAGPFNGKTAEGAPSRQRIFVCRPAANAADEKRCATKILATLARRAYRRPATDADVQTLLSFYERGRQQASFDAGIQLALERLLVSPEFLFRIERDPANATPGAPYRLSDLELASRLSFFLWSSIPDDELLNVAERGRLKDPKVLDQQVRRMLGDARAKALVSNFAGQWLYLRNMRTVTPDVYEFPHFDDNLREAFLRETELFFESQLREDRGVPEMLTANYTFANERLARHYGIPNVYGDHFRRVTLPDDRRAGLLGQGSILTVTSYANRTSPVLRGKWLLANILGVPPPEPPANVPPFPEKDKAKPTSVRERLEQHRRNPVCAACHAQFDPMGLALENFDGVGTWRSREGEAPVNASGVFLNGRKFSDPVDFRKLLEDNSAQFVRAVTEKLLTYAVGRGLETYDMPAVRAITRKAALNDYRWSSLILGVVNSDPFQKRTATEATRRAER